MNRLKTANFAELIFFLCTFSLDNITAENNYNLSKVTTQKILMVLIGLDFFAQNMARISPHSTVRMTTQCKPVLELWTVRE